MIRNPIVTEASNMAMAYGALRRRLPQHQTRSTSEGLEVLARGLPRILITWQAAEDFANEIQEAEHG